jgi:energy-coupling factor transporter ATP-binding protein EcfA2
MITKAQAIAALDTGVLTQILRNELIAQAGYIPDVLKGRKGWLLYTSPIMQKNDGSIKVNKVPHYANKQKRSGVQGNPADLNRLATFDDVWETFMQDESFAGVGFATLPDFGIVAYDGDKCVEIVDNHVRFKNPLTKDLIRGTYAEISPSGSGVRALFCGQAPSLKNNQDGHELFGQSGFVTITGDQFSECNDMQPLSDEQRGVLVKHCTSIKPGPKPAPQAKSPTVPVAEYPVVTRVNQKILDDLKSALKFMPSDDRPLWINMLHALKPLGQAGYELAQEWSAKSTLYDAEDFDRVWDSCKPTQTGYKAIFAEAQRQGWENPASASGGATDSNETIDLGEYVIEFEAPVEDEEMPHIIEPWLPEGEVTLLSGHGGSGKSYVALLLAILIALGRPFGSMPTKQVPVVFFSAEDSAVVLRRRLKRICRTIGVQVKDLRGKLFLLDISNLDPALYREPHKYLQDAVTQTALLDKLSEFVDSVKAGQIFIDNASDAYDGNEIVRAAVRTFIRSLRQRIAQPNRNVMLLAHVNKLSSSGQDKSGEDYSGSTAWHNSVRSRLSIIPNKTEFEIRHMKSNYAQLAEPVKFEWCEGVPMLKGSFTNPDREATERLVQAAELERSEEDKIALVSIIQTFDRRKEIVTTSMNGSFTVFKLLKGDPTFPKVLDSDRCNRLLRELQDEGRIYRAKVKDVQRKWKEVFTCNDLQIHEIEVEVVEKPVTKVRSKRSQPIKIQANGGENAEIQLS